jgi:hypothetical protein
LTDPTLKGGRMHAERHTRFSGQLIPAFGPSPRPICYST